MGASSRLIRTQPPELNRGRKARPAIAVAFVIPVLLVAWPAAADSASTASPAPDVQALTERIKQDSAVRITEYQMKSGFEPGSRSIIDLIKGGLRKITGSIGANPLSVYRFHAGIMTIGVRGTDYVVKLCDGNNCQRSVSRNDANASMHVAVLDGLISLQDEEGAQGELALGQYAVASADKVVKIDDARPVKGLLNEEERTLFDTMQPPDGEGSIWPWLLGSALLGL